MKTSTVVIIGVVGLAAVGGFIYWQHEKAAAAAAAAKARSSSSTSTGQKVATTVAAAIPLIGSIASLWS